jgi:NAD(P)-dependent dehydrogenase (short-subunit alcohol dehydrogenase family)
VSAPNRVGASAEGQPVVRRVALVTGASGGIGSAIARRLAADGFQLALTGRRADALAEVAASLASETGAEPFAAAADLTSDDQVASLVDAVRERHGRIDAVVNTAGGWSGSRIGPFVEKTEAELRAELENNLMTTVLVCHAVLPLMVAQRYGRIVNISSIAGLMGLRGHSVYAAAKAGQIGLARVLATELGEAGVTVNCVAPGPVGTPRVQQSLAAGRPGLLEMIQLTPNRRLAAPEEVADAVAYLASERAGHVNGQVVAVDGGMTIY